MTDRAALADRLDLLSGALRNPTVDDGLLTLAARVAGRELVDLARELTTAACPGRHHPRQHRDLLPPWCHDCRRTPVGEAVPEPPAAASVRRPPS